MAKIQYFYFKNKRYQVTPFFYLLKRITMTLYQVIKQLQRIALSQHNIRTVGEGDLYRDLNSDPSIKYNVFYITQNQHQSEGDFDRYNLNLFIISRLENQEGDNALQIQSSAKDVLNNIIEIFCKDFDSEVYGTIFWQPFTQRFSDLCAGMYAVVSLEVPKDAICPEI